MTDYAVDILNLGGSIIESGEAIDNLCLRYEHVGYHGQPLVVVCHALTGNHLTYGTDDYPGQWREIIDGGHIPIHDYQFLTFDVIGSPLGPSSPLNGPHFPKRLTLRNIVRANERGIQALGYDKINISMGGSLGGMQAVELLYSQQSEVDKAIILAATSRTSSYSRAFNEIARRTIHLGGKGGLNTAHQLGSLTCRSSKSYGERFVPDEVVAYRQHQGDKFKEHFDLDCYPTLPDVLDSHNIDWGRTDVTHVFKNLEAKVLTMGFIDDLLYPDDQVHALGERFKYHRHLFVPDNAGHDGSLLSFSIWAPNLCHFLNLKHFKRK